MEKVKYRKSFRTKRPSQIVPILILVAIAFIMYIIITSTLTHYEYRECETWKSEKNSTYANWQLSQCKNYGIDL